MTGDRRHVVMITMTKIMTVVMTVMMINAPGDEGGLDPGESVDDRHHRGYQQERPPEPEDEEELLR